MNSGGGDPRLFSLHREQFDQSEASRCHLAGKEKVGIESGAPLLHPRWTSSTKDDLEWRRASSNLSELHNLVAIFFEQQACAELCRTRHLLQSHRVLLSCARFQNLNSPSNVTQARVRIFLNGKTRWITQNPRTSRISLSPSIPRPIKDGVKGQSRWKRAGQTTAIPSHVDPGIWGPVLECGFAARGEDVCTTLSSTQDLACDNISA